MEESSKYDDIMNAVKSLAKNTSLLLISQVISYILAFFYMIYIARYLGTDGFGILSFALAFTGILSIFTDLGLNTLTVREVARDKSLTNKYFSNIFFIKMIFCILTFGLMALIINLLGYSLETINVVYLVGLSVIFTAISGFFNSIFQAHEKMEYQSLGLVLQNFLMFIGVLIVINFGLSIIVFAFVYFISSLISLFYILIVYFWKFPPRNVEIRRNYWKPTIKESLPFGLTAVFATVYVWIDSVMLSLMQGNEAVGLYNAAYRIIIVLLFIQSVSSISIFPTMSKFYISSKNSLKMTVEKYFKFMFIISIPIGIIVMLLSDKIILFVFGVQYENSILLLQILVWATVFTFIYTAFVQMFLSTNKQFVITKITALCMMINIILNLILIPQFSYIGASFVTVITEFTILVLVFKSYSKIGYGISRKQSKLMIKVIIASLIMGLFIFYFKELETYLLLLFAIIIYITLILLTKCIDKDDANLIHVLIKKS
ncbi:MAG: flippase [Methanobacterium sp.]|jgi:O-antigen/teichoic acid export membrane protein